MFIWLNGLWFMIGSRPYDQIKTYQVEKRADHATYVEKWLKKVKQRLANFFFDGQNSVHEGWHWSHMPVKVLVTMEINCWRWSVIGYQP